MPDEPERFTVLHFPVQSGRAGQGDVPALPRRVAESIEAVRRIEVQDVTFHAEPMADEDEHSGDANDPQTPR